jgi:MFS transporter, MHS family, alpha-ketoglutarate permease
VRLIAPPKAMAPRQKGACHGGAGRPYARTTSILGGTAESIALRFKSIGHETWFYYCLIAVIFESLVVYLLVR